MSTRVKVGNLSTDWRDHHKLRVTTQEKDKDGNWKDSTFDVLDAQDVLEDLWAHSGRRFILEEQK